MKQLDFKKIGERIRKRRNELDRTQAYIANYLDIDDSYISNIENGRGKISLTALVGISNALDCSVDYFLSDEYDNITIITNHELGKRLCQCTPETTKRIIEIIDVINQT